MNGVLRYMAIDGIIGDVERVPEAPQGFYSARPIERTVALKETAPRVRDAILDGIPEWPVKSPGALNSWLVFLGPSPGNSPGEQPWNFDPRPSIGSDHPGVAIYEDTKNYWNGIRQFAQVIFPELNVEDAYASTMVRNLVTDESPVAPTGIRMRMGAEEVVVALGRAIRPRLVVAMGGVRRYSDGAFRSINGIKSYRNGNLFTSIKRLPKPWFSLQGSWPSGERFLYTSVVGIHPSLFHVSRDDTYAFLRIQSNEAKNL